MNEKELRQSVANLRGSLRHVRAVAFLSVTLGIVIALFLLATAYAGRLTLGEAVFGGVGVLIWFWLIGDSVCDGSRWGFVALVISPALAFPSAIKPLAHLLRSVVEGTLTVDWPFACLCVLAVVQVVVTCFLFRYLLSKDVIERVWGRRNSEGSTIEKPSND